MSIIYTKNGVPYTIEKTPLKGKPKSYTVWYTPKYSSRICQYFKYKKDAISFMESLKQSEVDLIGGKSGNYIGWNWEDVTSFYGR